MMSNATLICDIETYPNFFLIAFKRLEDGLVKTFEFSERANFDHDRLRRIMMNNRIVTYNGRSYDIPMIFYALSEHRPDNAGLKRANDRIINGNVRWWDVEDLLGIGIPRRLDHVDLIEPQPNAVANLKILNGRLHGKRMQDLPYDPDQTLTHEEMDKVTAYCGNDLDATHRLWDALQEPLRLRSVFGEKYGLDLMSRSDSQCGEAIFKKRVRDKSGQKVQRAVTPPGTVFNFKPPDYISFTPGSELADIFDHIRATDFIIGQDGKVGLPKWLAARKIHIGDTVYQMGIGGLHSTESNRTIRSDDENILIDFDVGSYYPNTILNSGLYPKAIGPEFLTIYGEVTSERLQNKTLAADGAQPDDVRERAKTDADGVKIFINGGGFGKLGSPYSVMNAPHLLVTVTLTGQLALLMLIQRAEEAGIPVVSANTDGVVFFAPRAHVGPIKKDRVQGGRVADLIAQWEADTGFSMEATEYAALHNRSVNEYIAIKPGGKAKRKGKLSNPYKEGLRTQLMKNPNAGVCSDAVVAYLTEGTPIADYIRSATDIRDFVTVINVRGGGTWRGQYLGKAVRYIWAHDGEEIYYKKPNEKTGNYKKVSRTDGCRPLMDLPDDLPPDLNYDRYIHEANEILLDIGLKERPAPIKPLRFYKKYAPLWWAIAV